MCGNMTAISENQRDTMQHKTQINVCLLIVNFAFKDFKKNLSSLFICIFFLT